jgi:hypothetical protein
MITKELQNKLLTRCQHPRTVVNKYTHESVVVPCGSCPSCLLRRSAIQTNLLTTYSAQFRYAYFVTLTYAPCFLPTLSTSVIRTSRGKRFDSENPMEWKDLGRTTFGI